MKKYSSNDIDILNRIIFHCEMYLHGVQGRIEEIVEAFDGECLSKRFREFGLLHLISSMFLIDKENKPMGGFVYTLLKKLSLEHMLNNIKDILITMK